jgi:hypothetical protein
MIHNQLSPDHVASLSRAASTHSLFDSKRKKMKAKDVVKFKEPVNDEERDALMVIIEMRGDRALVADLRFSNWDLPPTDVYSVNDLEVVTKADRDSSFKLPVS